MSENDTPGAAKEKVLEVQKILLSDKYSGLSDFDNHRTLLRAAARSTNGHANDIAQLSETVGLFAATYVEDRTREHRRIVEAVQDIVVPAIADHAFRCAGKTQHTTTTTTTDKTTSDGVSLNSVMVGALKKYPLVVFFGLLGGFLTFALVICLAIVYHGETKAALEAVPGLDSPYTSTIAPADHKPGG